jgi:hypothetical protein
MKVVINRCFGGFGLSPLAVKEYLKRKGKECFCYDNSFSEKMKKVDIENANLFVIYSTKDLGEEITWEELKESYFRERDIPRNDADLVEVVKLLKDKADGRCASLKIVEIPDDVEWDISEYDGLETVEEKHISWL